MSTGHSELQTVKFRGADGLTLIADEWNRDGRIDDRPRPSLFLHGGGQNRYSWKNTCQILADEGLHVVALDSRGHGDSDRAPDANYSVDALCADTLLVLDQIGRPIVLIGASMGGMTGMPRRARGRAGQGDQAGARRRGAALREGRQRAHPRVHGQRPGRLRVTRRGRRRRRRIPAAPDRSRAAREGLKKNLRLRDGRWFWHWDPAFLTEPLDDPFVRVEKLEQAAIDLTIPILLIRGRLSDVVSEEGVKDFLEKVPDAEFVELSDAGHTAAGDDNDAFSEVVVAVRQPVSTPRRTVGFNFLDEPELPGPQVTEAQAEHIVAQHYGMTARAKLLGSNQDCNFIVSRRERRHRRRAQDRQSRFQRDGIGSPGCRSRPASPMRSRRCASPCRCPTWPAKNARR